MLRHLQGAWLSVLLLAAQGRAARFIVQEEGCQKAGATKEPPCEDEVKWSTLVSNVDKDIGTDFPDDEERIVLGPEYFAKIKKTPEYGCILQQIFRFFATVLKEGMKKGKDYDNLSHRLGRLQMCRLKVHCPRTCKEIKSQVNKMKMRKVRNVSSLDATELAKYQIKKLQRAKRRLAKDARTWKSAIIELKILQYYDSNKEVTVNCCATDRKGTSFSS